jgi:protein tyrosine phosphatase (PTP) superfamily phosphohydrolase (DUF442 family)
MEVVRQINDELAIAGCISWQELQQLTETGFKSILNLQQLSNDNLIDEKQQIERLGLYYLNFAINHKRINTELVAIVLQQIDELPKPILVCSRSARLAAAMVLMHIAVRQGETLEQAFERAENLGLFDSPDYELASPLSIGSVK